MKRGLLVMLMALLVCSAPALAAIGHFEDYEDPGWTPDTAWTDTFNVGVRETHADAGIPASKPGSTAHYRLDDSISDWAYSKAGGETVWSWHEDWSCSVDVWIDMDDPQIGTDDWWFELRFSMNKGTNHFRDFTFHVQDDADAGTVLAYLDGNSYTHRWPNNSDDIRTREYYAEVSETGWYTFKWHAYDDGGQLRVDSWMDDQQTSSESQAEWVTSGAEPYGGHKWFILHSYDPDWVYRVDNVAVVLDPIPEPASLALLGLGGLALLRRRR